MPKLSDIARELGVSANSHADVPITRVASLEDAAPGDLSYITSDRYLDRFQRSKASVILAPTSLELPKTDAFIVRVKDPELAIGRVLELLAPTPARPAGGVHPSAVIAADATVGADVSIGPNVAVSSGASIGERAILHAGVVIGHHSVVGPGCELYPNVVLRERVTLGARVIIHAGSVVGSDGFGYRWDGKQHVKIPQIGTVVIEDDVEIGSCSCIDRAKFGETRIGRGTKIDNLVQIGHNVKTGAHCILCGQSGVAGSSTLGNGVVMGGGSAIKDHVHVAHGTTVAGRGGVGRDTEPGEVLAGSPAVPHREWLRELAAIRKLPELIKQVRQLEEQVAQLKAKQ